MENDSTKRFTTRVDDYVKYRPHYPEAIINYLQQNYEWSKDMVLADIGAGTGISSALFLHAGYTVIAVEPNKEMREKSVELLQDYPAFTAIDGTAEHTGLVASSVDAVISGQAFHWFDPEKAKAEFRRILKTNGTIALIWNERKTTSDFEQEYDELIRKHGTNYVELQHRNIDDQHIGAFFSPEVFHLEHFENAQVFDFEGLRGRLVSSSYMPLQGDAGYAPMIADLEQLFKKYQKHNSITIQYDTKLYVGKVAS